MEVVSAWQEGERRQRWRLKMRNSMNSVLKKEWGEGSNGEEEEYVSFVGYAKKRYFKIQYKF